MSRLVFRPEARADLTAIYRFIASDAPRAARQFTNAIRSRLKILATYPDVGAARNWISPGLRILPLPGRIVVAYQVAATEVIILRIFYGGQDYEAFFRAEG